MMPQKMTQQYVTVQPTREREVLTDNSSYKPANQMPLLPWMSARELMCNAADKPRLTDSPAPLNDLPPETMIKGFHLSFQGSEPAWR